MKDFHTILLLQSDLVDPTKNKKEDITIDAFGEGYRPIIETASIVLYLSPKGGYVILQDKTNTLEGYVK